MAELPNPQEEQFCRLLAVGVKQSDAYWRCGWKKDKANASKKAQEPRIIERIAEIRMEEAAKEAARRREAGDLLGVEELRKEALIARSVGQHGAAVTGWKYLSEIDGSAEQVSPAKHQTLEEMVAEVERLGPLPGLYARFLSIRPGQPAPDETDVDLTAAVLVHYFSAAQIKMLGGLLLGAEYDASRLEALMARVRRGRA